MCTLKRALFFTLLFCGYIQSMQDEIYAIVPDGEPRDPVELLSSRTDNFIWDKEFNCELVEALPFDQLDLILFTQNQSFQKCDPYEKGSLFFYETELLTEVFKKLYDLFSFGTFLKTHGIRSLLRFEPSQKKPGLKPTALCIIHGTFGDKTEGYFDYTTEQFRGFVRYATDKAEKEGRSVDIFSIQWSGENNDTARVGAGIFLGYFLNMITSSYDNLDCIAFSHGCNVVLLAANNLINGCKIRECIALAPPMIEDNGWFYAPHNIKYFFPFISKGDGVAPLGRFWSKFYNNQCTQWKNSCQKSNMKEPYDKQGRIYKNPCEENGFVTNMHYTYNNDHPSHTQLPDYISRFLVELMAQVKEEFLYNACVRNLSINLVSQELCKEHQVQPLNISLFPQDNEEMVIYRENLREETITMSLQREEEHKNIYKRAKNAQDSYIQMGYKKLTNFFK